MRKILYGIAPYQPLSTHSTTVQIAEARRRRRRPLKENLESTTSPQQEIDKRAIKKAIRLVLEGAVSKATKVLDRKIKPNTLSDEEIFSQLKTLHPDGPITFQLPHDAPQIACITTEELRSAGRRLAKGAAPGPTGLTDGIIRLLLDDEVCCINLSHMLLDLINGSVCPNSS